MNLQLNFFDNVTMIQIVGRIDSHSVHRLRQQLAQSAERQGANIVLDLGGVDFIDSSGLAAIVHGMKQCRATGGDLRLCKLHQSVRMVLELTRLDRALDIFPNQEGALRSFAATTAKAEAHAVLS